VYAGFNGKSTIVKILLDAGADIEGRDKERFTTVFHAAACQDNSRVVQLLLDTGALELLDATDDSGNTPLHLATICNRLQVAKMLVQRAALGNQKNKTGATPFHIARELRGSERDREAWSRLGCDSWKRENYSKLVDVSRV
jgi:ankyrin repeat protein